MDHTFCKLSENTSKSYSGILISNMSDHLPHFTYLDILSNQQKPPKYITIEKHEEASLLSFYNEIEISLRNTHFRDELTTYSYVTHNLLKKIYCLSRGNITATNRNGHNRNGHKPKRPQTQTATNRNGHRPKRPQTGTATNRNGHKPKRPQTGTATNRNGHRPERPQTETATSVVTTTSVVTRIYMMEKVP